MRIPKIIATASLAFVALTVSAQDKADLDFQKMAQIQTYQVKQSVNGITPDQEKKILTIEQSFTQAMQQAHATSEGDRNAMHNQSVQLHNDRDMRMKSILTASQYAQYQKMEAANRSLAMQKDGPVK
jgi:hypothetical protein